MNKRILIYTAITGGYDALLQPCQPPEGFDFLCFVSRGMKHSEYEGVWRIEEIPYEWDDMTLLARSQKLNPHTVLPEAYDYSLWVDGNILIKDSSLYDICRDLADRDVHFAGIRHPFRDCVYEEMEAVLRNRRESLWKVLRLATFLCSKRVPRHAGLMETNIIFRRHNDPVVVEFDRWWWECLIKFSNRDQLTQTFALKDTEGMSVNYIFPEGVSSRNFHGVEYIQHPSTSLTWIQRKCRYGLNGLRVAILRAYISILKLIWSE